MKNESTKRQQGVNKMQVSSELGNVLAFSPAGADLPSVYQP